MAAFFHTPLIGVPTLIANSVLADRFRNYYSAKNKEGIRNRAHVDDCIVATA